MLRDSSGGTPTRFIIPPMVSLEAMVYSTNRVLDAEIISVSRVIEDGGTETSSTTEADSYVVIVPDAH